METAQWRWPESNRLRQRLQGAPATLAVTPTAGLGIICPGLPLSWCSRYGRVNYPACTRGFPGWSIRLEVNENRPGGTFPGAAAGQVPVRAYPATTPPVRAAESRGAGFMDPGRFGAWRVVMHP